MEMTGEERIPAPRAKVWDALNDPEVLRRCIPGCQELVKESETEMTAIVVVKVGPISARFQGRVTLSDIDPPSGYRITGEGQGGVAGHARGDVIVCLAEDGDGTLLSYEVAAQIGGRLAQLGGRMIDATAKTMAGAFFRQFAKEVVGGGESEPSVTVSTAGGQVPDRGVSSAGGRGGAAVLAPSVAAPAPGRWMLLLAGIVMGAIIMAVIDADRLGDLGATHVVLAALAGFLAARLMGGPPLLAIVERGG